MVWRPISESELCELIARELAECSSEEQAWFARVAVPATKWQQSPWGDLGGGFWAVAVVDDRVLWYNDIEDGFNVSRFDVSGTIPAGEYWCNQDSIKWALPALAGKARTRLGPPRPIADM
jgi:hypothetical protein